MQPIFDVCMNDNDVVSGLDLDGLIARAIALLKANEPPEGYFLAYSGGKDSVAILKLAKLAGVRFDAHHNFTTIDPPELVRFVMRTPGIVIDRPEKNMFVRIAENPAGPPNRFRRWCCKEYKEHGGTGRSKVMGVRAAESRGRARRWREVASAMDGSPVICPIVYWSDAQVWEFIRALRIEYCALYNEGFDRLGCVGCPLANKCQQREQFARWPRFEANWRRAIIANWERFKDKPNRFGLPRYHARFKTGEEFWQAWLTESRPDFLREECQSGILWTNQPGDEDGSSIIEVVSSDDHIGDFERRAMEEAGK